MTGRWRQSTRALASAIGVACVLAAMLPALCQEGATGEGDAGAAAPAEPGGAAAEAPSAPPPKEEPADAPSESPAEPAPSREEPHEAGSSPAVESGVGPTPDVVETPPEPSGAESGPTEETEEAAESEAMGEPAEARADAAKPEPRAPEPTGEAAGAESDPAVQRQILEARRKELSAARREDLAATLESLRASVAEPDVVEPGEPTPPRGKINLDALTRLSQTARVELAACRRYLAECRAELADAETKNRELRRRMREEPAAVRAGRRLISNARLDIDALAEEGIELEGRFSELKTDLAAAEEAIARYSELLAVAEDFQNTLVGRRSAEDEDSGQVLQLAADTASSLNGCADASRETYRSVMQAMSRISENIELASDLSVELESAMAYAAERSITHRRESPLAPEALRTAWSDFASGLGALPAYALGAPGRVISGVSALYAREGAGGLLLRLLGIAALAAPPRIVRRFVRTRLRRRELGVEPEVAERRRWRSNATERTAVALTWSGALLAAAYACLAPVYDLWVAAALASGVMALTAYLLAARLALCPRCAHRLLLQDEADVRRHSRFVVTLGLVFSVFYAVEWALDVARYETETTLSLVRALHALACLGLIAPYALRGRPTFLHSFAGDSLSARLIVHAGALVCLTLLAYIVLLLSGYPALGSLVARGILLTGLAYYALLPVAGYTRRWITARRNHLKRPHDGFESASDDTRALRLVAWDLLLFCQRIGAAAAFVFAAAWAWRIHRPHLDYAHLLLSRTALTVQDTSISLIDVAKAVVLAWAVYVAASLARRLMEASPALERRLGSGGRYAAATLWFYVLVAAGGLWALLAAGLQWSILTAFAGMAGIGLGFGLQDVVRNFVAGLILLTERPIQVGDLIEIGLETGYVAEISLRSTTLRTFDNRHIVVPNSTFISTNIANISSRDPSVRCDVNVGVAYGTDLKRVRDLLLDIARADDGLLTEPAPQVFILGFGESSIDLSLRVWVGEPDIKLSTTTRLSMEVVDVFAREGVEIPFPQRDVHLKPVPPV